LSQLKVIARNSSFKYRGANIDFQDVANKLGVQAIVTGKVVRIGDNLTVRVEMIDAKENRQLWSEQYNRKASDVLVVQQEIAQAASEKLRLKLSGAQEQRFAELNTVNPQAYELLLKGRYVANSPGAGNTNKVIEYYQQAIAVDPNYALAYAELSQRYRLQIANSLGDPKEFRPKADAAARKALELDGNLAEAHLALASLHKDAWDWSAAEAEYKRAIELNSNLGRARGGYSTYLSVVGRHDESIAEVTRHREIDPLSLPANVQLALSFYFARRYDESIEASKKTLELHKSWGYLLLGYAYAGKGMHKEAIESYEASIREGNPSPSVRIYLGASYARAGEREKAQEILKKLETSKEYVSPAELAILYTALEDKEAAFRSFEKGFAEHDQQLQYLNVESALDFLRDDPRLQNLQRRVGLPQ
jgi:tetratricopeptide (TPR) repeat protein